MDGAEQVDGGVLVRQLPQGGPCLRRARAGGGGDEGGKREEERADRFPEHGRYLAHRAPAPNHFRLSFRGVAAAVQLSLLDQRATEPLTPAFSFARDRKRVVSGKGVCIRVESGGGGD